MPIVFVHGVNVRRDLNYDGDVAQRNAYLRQYALVGRVTDPAQVQIFNPYWGDLAANLAWKLASLPPDEQETFGEADDLETILSDRAIELTADPDNALVKMARQSLPEVIDLLFIPAMQQAGAEQLPELMALANKACQYANHHPQPNWLNEVQDDRAFVGLLQQVVDAWHPGETLAPEAETVSYESFGGSGSAAWNAVEWGTLQLQQSLSRLSGQVISAKRAPIQEDLSRFLGDAFKYVQTRGDRNHPGAIVETVIADLEAALAAKSEADPYLIVIAHSMGGNISYDILSYYRPDISVDVFVTIGSQVSLLEELKLFNKLVPNVPGTSGDRIPKPGNIAHWMNIYNRNDVLSFACERVFADVVDFEFPAGSLFGMRAAHSVYFQRISFYERFAYRLRRLLV